MLMGPDNFLYHVQNIVTGGGRDSSGNPKLGGGFLKDESRAPQSVATTGTRATAENSVPADVIVIDADDEDAIPAFTIPRDYDEQTDHLKCVLLVAYVSGTSIALQANAVSRGNTSTALADESDFTAATATTVNAAFDIGEIEADLSALSWNRHDTLAVNFVASARDTNGIAHILGCRWEYRSCLVSHDEEDASGNALR